MTVAAGVRAVSYHTDVAILRGGLIVRRVFPRAWHLQDDSGWVLTVTTAPYGGPLAIRVQRPTLADLPVSPGTPASLRSDGLVIGPVHIRLDGAIPWSPRRAQDAPSLSFPALRRDLRSGSLPSPLVGGYPLGAPCGCPPGSGDQGRTVWYSDAGGRGTLPRFAGWVPGEAPLSDRYWPRANRPPLNRLGVRGAQLAHALLRGDERAMQAHALGLLGLGPGLTPAGDDLLCGLLAGLRVLGERTPGLRLWTARRVTVLDTVIGRAARTRTTALSRTLLYYAARSLAVEPLLDVLCTLGSGDAISGQDELLTIGHSSGHDMLAGALLAARAILQGGGSA